MTAPIRASLTLALLLAAALTARAAPPIVEARAGFTTKLLRQERIGQAAPEPPESSSLKLVHYPAPLGANAAYVSAAPADGKKHPAIIWLTGGFSNSISPITWTPGPATNDQSAAGFRSSGILMMYPSLRGGNDNPGCIEAFYGEVDDVLAAAKYLASLDYIDPARIYLGGHSTGGTLALLVAAAAGDRFRAVFSLGPVDNVVGYGADVLPFDLGNPLEGKLRAPQRWLSGIRCTTVIFEGTEAPGNIASLRALERGSGNSRLQFRPVPGETHFSVIAPLVLEISRSIRDDAQRNGPFKFGLTGSRK
jgi:pimeloyl-ACP methyl ester carboxylesterase